MTRYSRPDVVDTFLDIDRNVELGCSFVLTYNVLDNSLDTECNIELGCFSSMETRFALRKRRVWHLGFASLSYSAICWQGFYTVAVSRGQEKKEGALKLGAHKYIDATTEDPVKEIQVRTHRADRSWYRAHSKGFPG